MQRVRQHTTTMQEWPFTATVTPTTLAWYNPTVDLPAKFTRQHPETAWSPEPIAAGAVTVSMGWYMPAVDLPQGVRHQHPETAFVRSSAPYFFGWYNPDAGPMSVQQQLQMRTAHQDTGSAAALWPVTVTLTPAQFSWITSEHRHTPPLPYTQPVEFSMGWLPPIPIPPPATGGNHEAGFMSNIGRGMGRA